jgi:hypothetical protein
VRESSLGQIAKGGFAEYFEPFTGEPLGSREQSWTAAVALDWLILRIAAGPGAVVLDPFGGSGTTAQAVLEQNASDGGHREFVLIEAADRARTLIPRRLAEVAGTSPDYGFYTLMPPEHEELVVGCGADAWQRRV